MAAKNKILSKIGGWVSTFWTYTAGETMLSPIETLFWLEQNHLVSIFKN